jgi:Flp pilus assembly protein, pilin Flp
MNAPPAAVGQTSRASKANVRELFTRLLREEAGQDLIEYALLTALIGTVGILAWQNIGSGIGNAYSWWDTGIQDLSGCTPDPGGGGC